VPTGSREGDTPGAATSAGFVRDAGWTVGSRLLLAAIIVVSDVILARTLGPEGKGRFALVLLVAQLLAVGVGLGLERAIAVTVARGTAIARASLANGVVWVVVAGGLASLVTFAAGAWGWLPNLSTRDTWVIAAAVPLELLFLIGLEALLGRRRLAAYNVARLARRLVLLVGVVAVAFVPLDLGAALAANLVALVAAGVVILGGLRRDGVAPSRPDLALLRQHLGFGIRAWPGTLGTRAQLRADALLINAIIGVGATGVYSVASSVAETLWYVPSAIAVVVFSRTAALGIAAASLTSTATRVTLALGLAGAIPVALLAPVLVPLVYGASFAAAGTALQLLLPGVVAYGVATVVGQFLTAAGAPGRTTVAVLAGLTVNLLLDLVAIPRFGIAGAAVAASVGYGVTALLLLRWYVTLTGQRWTDALLLRRSDLSAVGTWLSGRRAAGTAGG
jgi:O-antigen/teichoic acid export membrane protein